MAKPPILHPYSSQPAMDRLLLLVAAIAQNPGIASQNEAYLKGVDPMDLLLDAMEVIAEQQGVEFKRWSVNTIRKDIGFLRAYGILPADTALRQGYYLGNKQVYAPVKVPKKPRRTKSKLSTEEIKQLREQGETLQAIGDKAGLSREAVRQILLEA